MRGWNRKISAIVGRILIIGFSVQIVSGMVWTLFHVGYFQEFPESYFLEKVSKTLVCDEYTGILYPFLIRMLQGLGRVIPIPYFSVLYLLQLLAAFGAAWYFLGGLKPFQRRAAWKKAWAALALLTFPMAMQCHMAVLPISLATSLFLVQLGVLERGLWNKEGGSCEKAGVIGDLVRLGTTGLAMGLILPEYRYFGAIPLLFYAVFEILGIGVAGVKQEGNSGVAGVKQEENSGVAGVKQVVWIALVAAAFLGMGGRFHDLFTQEGAYGRMQNTLEAAAFRRFAWDDFGEFYSEWPDELRDALTQEEIRICNSHPLQKEWILGEKVDAVYGREKARKIYGQMQAITGKVRFKRNLKEILKDCVYYSVSPVMQLWLMEGHGQPTLSGRNLDVMRAKTPEFTMLYVRYGYLWFAVALSVALVQGLVDFGRAGAKTKKRALQKACWYMVVCGMIILWYTMQGGGIMDYKNGLIVTVLWGSMICCRVFSLKEE